MAASVAELILARVKTVLTGATLAGARVERGSVNARAVDELPALFISRDASPREPVADSADRMTLSFTVDCVVRGADWETTADALHVEVHTALFADATLATLGRGLRCVDAVPEVEEGDTTTARLRCEYQIQVMVRRHDLTKIVN